MIAPEGSAVAEPDPGRPRSGRSLFLHSAYPTDASDAVFLGPDSYRFARFLLAELAAEPADWLVDIGAGAGVGAISRRARAAWRRLLLTDINPLALRLARINARHAGVEAELSTGDRA